MIEQRPFTQHQVDNYCGATSSSEEVASVVHEGGLQSFSVPVKT